MAHASKTKHSYKPNGGVQAGKAGPDQAPRQGPDDALHVHTLHADLPIPYFTPGDITANARTARSKLAPRPAPQQIAFYGGLGALAVLGAIEWPVAVAIGAATAVARSGRRGTDSGSRHLGEHAEGGAK